MKLWHWLALACGVGLAYLRGRGGNEREEILRLLADGRERSGRELVRESPRRIRPGSVYVSLAQLEDRGLVAITRTDRSDPDRLPRHFYRITHSGRLEGATGFMGAA